MRLASARSSSRSAKRETTRSRTISCSAGAYDRDDPQVSLERVGLAGEEQDARVGIELVLAAVEMERSRA